MRVASVVRGVAVLAVFGAVYGLATTYIHEITGALERLGELGPVGDAMFTLVYAVGSWLMMPASLFQGAAGFLYGPVFGILVSWGLSTMVGALSYEMARGFLREPVSRHLERHLAAIDRALARRGLYAVVLLRLSPLAPYNIVSYALGATGVPRRTFWVGTAIGSLFPAATWTIVGASVSDLASLTTGEADFGPARWLVLAATVIATVGIALFVRNALADPEPDDVPEAVPAEP